MDKSFRIALSKVEGIISLESIAIIIALVLFFLFLKNAKVTKMNVNEIIKAHISTLKHSNSNKLNSSEVIIFFIFPLLLSILLTWKSTILSTDVNVIITVFAIFVGFLFNLLVLIFDMAKKVKNDRGKVDDANIQNLKEQLIKETYTNTSYCVLLSIILLCLSFLYVVGISNSYILFGISIVIYWLIITFVLTLFMVLKRIYTLLSEEIS